jgi:hypothetical protein
MNIRRVRLWVRIAAILVLAVLLGGGLGQPTRTLFAATLVVDSLSDDIVTCNGAPLCLREAIIAAASGDTITFSGALSLPGTITLTQGEIGINKNLTISGPGAGLLTINANFGSRHFLIGSSAVTVTLGGVTLSNGSATTEGGAIRVIGGLATLTLSDSVLASNTAQGGGGAIAFYGSPSVLSTQLLITRTHFTLNNATGAGLGGVLYLDGAINASITNSSMINNQGVTGAVIAQNNATLDTRNITLADNMATSNAVWEIPAGSTASLRHVTVAGNYTPNVSGVGGIRVVAGGVLNLVNSLIAGNVFASSAPPKRSTDAPYFVTGAPSNVSGVVTSYGYNLVQERAGSTGYIATDLLDGTDPLINFVAVDNQVSLLYTVTFSPDSPARDVIPPYDSYNNAGVNTDQRGIARPGNSASVRSTVAYDVGAYEYEEFPLACTPTLYAPETFAHTVGTAEIGNGYDASIVFSPDSSRGFFFNYNPTTGYSLANDFIVPVDTTWSPNRASFYGYQTNSGTSPSPILSVNRLSLWNGTPGAGGSVIAEVSSTTGFQSIWTNIYRQTGTTLTDKTRPVFVISVNWPATFPTTLASGTYWLEWGVSVASGSAFQIISVPSTSDNSRQFDADGPIIWVQLQDQTSSRPVDLPYTLCGTKQSLLGTPTPTPTLMPTNTLTATPSRTPTATFTATNTATPTLTPAPNAGDRIGVFFGGTFYLRFTNSTGTADIIANFGGEPSDLPVVGDWNADGVDTIGVYRGNEGVFYLSDSNTTPAITYNFVLGNPGDSPFAGRWTADMTGSGTGVYRNSNGILYQKKTLVTGVSDFFAVFGNPGDVGYAGDWNADGLDSIGIYRASNTTWYMTNNGSPDGITFSDIDFVWSIGSGTQPVVGDWDGDGITTVGHLSDTGVFTLHPTLATVGVDNIFAFGPANSRPVAGKWTVGSRPNSAGVVVQPGKLPPYTNEETGNLD